MFATIHRMQRLVQSQPTGQKPVTAVLTMERDHEEQGSDVLPRRLPA